MPKPVCVCVRNWPVNPAYIPGPDINTVLESRGARLTVMLEERSLYSTLTASNEERGRVGADMHTVCWIYSASAVLDQCSCQNRTKKGNVFVSVLLS